MGGVKPLAVITFIPERYIIGPVDKKRSYRGAVPGEYGTLFPTDFNIKGTAYGFEYIRERVTPGYATEFRLYQGGNIVRKTIVMRINGVDYTVTANSGYSGDNTRIGLVEGVEYTIEIFDII